MINTRIKNKSAQLIVLTVITFMLIMGTGCWDRLEIDDRALVLGVGIDKPEHQKKESGSETKEIPKGGLPKYSMSLCIPVFTNSSDSGGGEEEGGGGQQPDRWILTSTGNTIQEIVRIYANRSSRMIVVGHMKVLVIGEQVAREGIADILDYFTRDVDAHGRIMVVIANGKAKEILDITPYEEDYSPDYIEKLLQEGKGGASKIEGDMVSLLKSLTSSGNAVLPRVRAGSKSDAVVGGSALIKDYKMVGWLGEWETSGVNTIRDKVEGGSLSIVAPGTKEELMSIRLNNVKVKRDVTIKAGQPIFKIRIFSEGEVVEKPQSVGVLSSELLKEIERRVILEMQHRSIATVTKLQREFKADVLEFGDLLSKKHPQYWAQVEKDWDEKYFPKAEVLVESDAKIRRVDVTR